MPCRPGTAPLPEVAGELVARAARVPSRTARRRCARPSPVCSRSCSAARMPSAAQTPVPWSIIETPTRTPEPALFARHAEDAAGGLRERVVARPRAPRALASERADRGVHEPRIARANGVRVRSRVPRRGPAAGSGRRRRRRRRAAAGRRGRGAGRARPSACPRSWPGTSCSRRSRRAGPTTVPRRRPPVARP